LKALNITGGRVIIDESGLKIGSLTMGGEGMLDLVTHSVTFAADDDTREAVLAALSGYIASARNAPEGRLNDETSCRPGPAPVNRNVDDRPAPPS
jgi:hypothetical protein